MSVLLIFSFAGCKSFNRKDNNHSEDNKPAYEPDDEYIDVYDDDVPSDDTSGDETHPDGEVYLTSITVTPPTKVVYEMGEEFDLSGLSVVANYSDETHAALPLENVELSSINTYKLGEHTFTVKYQNKTDSFTVNVIRTYNEPSDSTEGINTSDLSGLTSTFSGSLANYTSKTISYFNSRGAYDYYRHYRKNYVQAKNNFHTANAFYNYPYLEEYLSVMNKGYLNKDNNYYSYSLQGDTVSDRLSYNLTNADLSLEKENARYQDDMFSLDDLNSEYFAAHTFTRVSENKYECNELAVITDFIDICAPNLINEGAYMTFKKVSIEINVSTEVQYRIRLFASEAQTGKLIEDSLDQENKPNWYLLFSEALISDVGTTTFAPASSLLN